MNGYSRLIVLVAVLAGLLAPACGVEGEYRLHVVFPDPGSRQALARITLWALEDAGEGCAGIDDGSVRPDSLTVLSQMDMDPAGDSVQTLKRVPAGAVLFAAEGFSPEGYMLLRGCRAAEVRAGKVVEVTVRLVWVCRPAAGGEIRGNGVDDDCDGLTDECLEDGHCNDNNPCTADACDEQVCRNLSVEDGTGCDDGAYCTMDDACQGGVCTGQTNPCDDGDPCTQDGCDEVLNRCDHTPVLEPGSEGPPGDQTCANGVDDDCDGWTDGDDPNCRACTRDADCDDGFACTDDACVGQVCINVPLADGQSCDDGDPCTMDETCNGGICRGAPLDADGDGYGPEDCGGDDCDDGRAEVNPGASEGAAQEPECHDGRDNDCDGLTDYDHPECLQAVTVVPVYPGRADWNDYVKNADPSRDVFHQDGADCEGGETGGYAACLHGGEMRAFIIPGRASCDGLVARDALGAFLWECDDNGGQGPTSFRSRSLASGRGLGDLLDAQGFLQNRVSVESGGREMASSPPAVWDWSNPVLAPPENASGGVAALDTAGAVYVVAQDALSAGYNLDADRIALVVLPGFTLTYSGDGSYNCRLDTGEAASPNAVCLLAAGGQRFLWIEGSYHSGSGANHSRYGAALAGVGFLVVRNAALTGHRSHGLRCSGAANGLIAGVLVRDNWGGVSIGESDHLAVRDVTARSNSSTGVYIGNSGGVDVSGVVCGDNGGAGLYLSELTGARVRRVQSFNSGTYGVRLTDSSDCFLNHVTVSNTAFVEDWERAVLIGGCRDVVVTQLVTFANDKHGLALIDSHRTTVSHVSSFNNYETGVQVLRADDCTLNQILTVNNRHDGLSLGDLTGTLIANLAATHNQGSGPYGWNADLNTFTGYLVVGNNNDGGSQCYMGGTGLTAPGLISGTCTDDGTEGSSTYSGQTSDAVLYVGRNLTFSFAAKVFLDDAVNQSDQDGLRACDLVEDWTGFENRCRGWGADGGGFPGESNRGRCASGENCRIWDWRVTPADTVARGFNGSFAPGQECPAAVHGNLALTDRQIPPNVFLMHAEEILDDQIGDDDGLCESNERCVFSPNLGAYQGDRGLTAGPCRFTDGLVTGVSMYAHANNGA